MKWACLFGGYTAVSYTHLDVYKRQADEARDQLVEALRAEAETRAASHIKNVMEESLSLIHI